MNITYTWSPNGNSGTLTTSLDETLSKFTSAYPSPQLRKDPSVGMNKNLEILQVGHLL